MGLLKGQRPRCLRGIADVDVDVNVDGDVDGSVAGNVADSVDVSGNVDGNVSERCVSGFTNFLSLGTVDHLAYQLCIGVRSGAGRGVVI